MQENYSKLRLIPGFHIKELGKGRLMLLSEGDNYCIQDSLSAEIIKYLKDKDSLVSLDDIRSRLQDLGMTATPEKLQKIAQEMIKIPLVTSQESSLPKNIQAFLFKVGVSPEVAEEKLKMQKVAVSSLSRCPASELEEILHGLCVQTGKEGSFNILIVDDYLDTRIQEFGLLAQDSNKPWMLVKPHGRSLWMGPIFRSDQPALASYESLALRLKENRSAEIDALGTTTDHFDLPSLMALPNAGAIGLNIAALETLKWIVSGSSGLISNILTFDCTDLNIQFHYIDIHPSIKNSLTRKTFSSEKARQPSIKLLLNSSKKTFFDDDGARTRTPEETWKHIEHLASPITGLMSKIIYKQQNNYHIYYGPRSLPHSDAPIGHIRSPEIVVGKSTSIIKAKVGCIAEAIERYFCTNHQLHPQYVFAYQEKANDSIHPQVLLNFSPTQYAQRETTNAKWGPYQWVHRPFDETKKIHWLRLRSLNSSKQKYIPSAYCYMNNNDRQEHLICSGDSNGCACGNSLEEALFYGISEVIERDAVAIWWYNCLRRPSVDLDSFSNSAIKNIASRIKAQDRYLRVIDISTDLDIPAFVAISWKNDGSRIVFGTNAHLDPQIGVVRALGELHQMLTRADVSENIDISGVIPAERDVVRWLIHEKLEQHPFLYQENGKKKLSDYPVNENEDFLDDLHIYFQKLRARSLDVYALNLTPLNSPMAVVKVIIPTMRHFWARYGEGRLYQVPVTQGDRLNPLKESELNPMPYFL